MIPNNNVIPSVMRSGIHLTPMDITWYLTNKNFQVHMGGLEISMKKSLMPFMMIKEFLKHKDHFRNKCAQAMMNEVKRNQ
jgi:hypothetical protein